MSGEEGTHIIRRDRTDQQLCDRETIRAFSEEFLHLKRHALRESLLGKGDEDSLLSKTIHQSFTSESYRGKENWN